MIVNFREIRKSYNGGEEISQIYLGKERLWRSTGYWPVPLTTPKPYLKKINESGTEAEIINFESIHSDVNFTKKSWLMIIIHYDDGKIYRSRRTRFCESHEQGKEIYTLRIFANYPLPEDLYEQEWEKLEVLGQ